MVKSRCCAGGRCAARMVEMLRVVDDALCRWPRCCVGGRGVVSVVEELCGWSMRCADGRCAVSVVDVLSGGRGAARGRDAAWAVEL